MLLLKKRKKEVEKRKLKHQNNIWGRQVLTYNRMVYRHVGADLTPYNLNQNTNGEVYRNMEIAGVLATSKVTA